VLKLYLKEKNETHGTTTERDVPQPKTKLPGIKKHLTVFSLIKERNKSETPPW
jgi:hypothetical protein